MRGAGRWLASGLKRLIGKPASTRLSAAEIQAIEGARLVARGDCEQAAEVLRKTLAGGTKRRFAGDRLLHEVYEWHGKVFDVTAKQYVHPGVWTQEELAQAGLIEAVETGAFTPQQHKAFMEKVIRALGGVED
jgi:hypothetical protein